MPESIGKFRIYQTRGCVDSDENCYYYGTIEEIEIQSCPESEIERYSQYWY